MKDLSIIIVNYRGGERLIKCLESIQNVKDSRFSFEVVVVDNQSGDGSLALLSHLFPHFTFVSNSGNNGFANGCNLGAAKSRGANILFLNPDTTVTAAALFDMLEEIRVRPENSIVSCSQVREDGSFDRPYGKFLRIPTLTGWLRAINQFVYGRIEDSIVQTKHYVYPDWVSGSVLMIRRDSFNRLGGWNDDFWMYFEDVDLCKRALQNKGEIVLLKNAVIGHIHGVSSRLNPEISALTKSEVNISRHAYISKHEKSEKAFFMHLLLIINTLVIGLIPALLGLFVLSAKRLHVISLVYFNMVEYYFQVFRTGNWISIRSVNYPRKQAVPEEEPVFSRLKHV